MNAHDQRDTARVARCPSSMALSRAFRGGDAGDYDPASESVRRHVSECERCGREWRGLEVLVEAARELPAPGFAPQRSEAMRTALLIEARAALPRAAGAPLWRRPVVFGAVFATAAAAAMLLWIGGGKSGHSVSPGAATEPVVASVVGGATVQAPEGANFVHTAKPSAGGTDEVVRLQRGRVTVAVHELDVSRRFRVVTGNAELEARAAAFDVEVSKEDQLLAVVVHSGNVRVRVSGQQTVLLGAGERYQPRVAAMADISLSASAADSTASPSDSEDPNVDAMSPAADRADDTTDHTVDDTEEVAASVSDDTVTSHAAPRAARRARHREPAASRDVDTSGTRTATAAKKVSFRDSSIAAEEPARTETSSLPPAATESRDPASNTPAITQPARRPVDVAFQQGWSLMRSGRPGAFARAARSFARAIALAPTDPMAEDARYWRSVALARAGKTAEASIAMRGFLERHAASPRATELSVMLGWIELEAGAYGDARRHFRAGLGDRNPKVATSAKAGLASLPK